MAAICRQCGKTIDGEGMAFCPYCGAKLEAPAEVPSVPADREAEKWIQKAKNVPSYPERRKILLKGLEACPDSREIAWELLFTGEPESKKKWAVDFSVIKSWILEIYWQPKQFSAEKKDRMRSKLFDDPELQQTLNRFENPQDKQREYLQRLCREYVELFLEGSNQVMGNVFGFRTERNKEKKLAGPVAQMIDRIKTDEKLSPDQREQLWKAMYQAYASRAGGSTQYLDEKLNEE